jgi:hypothetical protein
MAAALQVQAQRLFLTASTSSSPSLPARPRRRAAVAPCRAAVSVDPDGLNAGLGLKLEWADPRALPARTTTDTKAAVEKLRAVGEAAADRAEMHDIIGRQRDGWNHLLVHSTNSLALAVSVMAVLASGAGALRPRRGSSVLLDYLGALHIYLSI